MAARVRVNNSFKSQQGAAKFYAWLERVYQIKAKRFTDRPHLDLNNYLAFKKQDLQKTTDVTARVSKERAFAASLHKAIKTVLPKFSLDQGFEFRNALGKGERQCFLQSVLIAALLQDGGVPAGVAMVNRNAQGQETNNKHAVCIARLSNGHDLMVDASDDQPFARHQGLFMQAEHGFRFLRPVFDTDSSIVAYRAYESNTTLAVNQIQPLNRYFIQSQFEYYRGERTKGGVMASIKTPGGMAAADFHLTKSLSLCPDNPLAAYMLGKVQSWEHQAEARQTLENAMRLYVQDGWVPPDEREALSQADRPDL